MKNMTLDTRIALPDALRILMVEYPREAWESDPNFHGLVAFWLDRHLMFRRLLEQLSRETEGALDSNRDPRKFAGSVSRYGGMLVNQLHGHHQIEDQHYFPVLAQKDARIQKGFDLLDADHHALDGYLASFVESANEAIHGVTGGRDPKTGAEAFRRELALLSRLLDRHLIDEEELVVPVILKHGSDGLG